MSATWAKQLNSLLEEDPQAAAHRAATGFDTAAGPCSGSIVLFGAGGLGRKTLRGLRKCGLEPVAFADNNPNAWSTTIEGVRVLSPEAAAQQFGKSAVFIVTIWRAGGGHRFDITERQLRKLRCQRVVPAALLFWKFPETFLDYYCLGLPQNVLLERERVLQAFSWFTDERSQKEFVAQIRWRLWLDFHSLPSPGAEEQYFPDDLFQLGAKEVFVDCGAFDGDSVAAFIHRQGDRFEQIIALEPDPLNFSKMCERVAQYPLQTRRKIRLEQLGASDFEGAIRFDADGSLSSAANPQGEMTINCVQLDQLLRGERATYIKMDIEGAEPEALRGAVCSVQSSAPTLAISAYHKQNHLWQIPEIIKSLDCSYRIYLRPHNEECWDTVCYAVPLTRLN